jgi:sugar phosphate isomerase/epimerase
MAIGIGINLEFVRHADKPFEYGVKKAAELGYEFVEPCVATGRDLLAEAGYYHMLSMEEDPLYYKAMLDELGLKVSGLSAHSPLMKLEVAVPYLTQAIRWAADIGAPVVNTDEGPKPAWIENDEEAFAIMRYTLKRVLPVAERHGIIDWHAIVRVLKRAGFSGVLSVECGTEEQAAKSIAYLKKVLQEVEA